MCEYCEDGLMNSIITDIDNEFPGIIKEYHGKYYFDIEQCFEDNTKFIGSMYSLDYCFKCGRKLND